MTIEQTHADNRDVIRNAGLASAGGVLASEAVGHRYFKNNTSISQALLRAGIAGVATTGALIPIEKRLYRSANTTAAKMRVKEASSTVLFDQNKQEKYAGTDFKEFVKTAASVMGPSADLVDKVAAYDAFKLYCTLPEKTAAAVVVGLYDQMLPGMNKVAMEMVAANVLAREKQASLMAGAKMLGRGAGKAVEPALTASGIYSGTKDRIDKDQSFYQQGRQSRR